MVMLVVIMITFVMVIMVVNSIGGNNDGCYSSGDIDGAYDVETSGGGDGDRVVVIIVLVKV
jgi:hypothetical protein